MSSTLWNVSSSIASLPFSICSSLLDLPRTWASEQTLKIKIFKLWDSFSHVLIVMKAIKSTVLLTVLVVGTETSSLIKLTTSSQYLWVRLMPRGCWLDMTIVVSLSPVTAEWQWQVFWSVLGKTISRFPMIYDRYQAVRSVLLWQSFYLMLNININIW